MSEKIVEQCKAAVYQIYALYDLKDRLCNFGNGILCKTKDGKCYHASIQHIFSKETKKVVIGDNHLEINQSKWKQAADRKPETDGIMNFFLENYDYTSAIVMDKVKSID